MTPDARSEAAAEAAAALRAIDPPLTPGLVAGFDGFIDRIIDVVDVRTGPDAYRRIDAIASLADRVAHAAGRSANLELVVKRTALGGNGAILAHAAGRLGVDTTFFGTVGEGSVDPLFEPLAGGGRRVRTLGAPGRTDALEFNDGKLLLGEPGTLRAVTWERVRDAAGGLDALRRTLHGRVLAMGNWTMTPGMTRLWHELASEALPGAGCAGIFVDLADPAKRPDQDLSEALDAMRAMNAHAPVTLGLNLAESERLARLTGAETQADQPADAALATRLREHTGLAEIAAHSRKRSSISNASGAAEIEGPFVSRPAASTGAGDHFNAGLCVGSLLGLDAPARLALGVGCSGLFVRTGVTPERETLAAFLDALPNPE